MEVFESLKCVLEVVELLSEMVRREAIRVDENAVKS